MVNFSGAFDQLVVTILQKLLNLG